MMFFQQTEYSFCLSVLLITAEESSTYCPPCSPKQLAHTSYCFAIVCASLAQSIAVHLLNSLIDRDVHRRDDLPSPCGSTIGSGSEPREIVERETTTTTITTHDTLHTDPFRLITTTFQALSPSQRHSHTQASLQSINSISSSWHPEETTRVKQSQHPIWPSKPRRSRNLPVPLLRPSQFQFRPQPASENAD